MFKQIQMATISDIHAGDVLKIKGLDNTDKIVHWWGQKVGVTDDNKLEVYLLEPCPENPNMLRYNGDDLHTMPIESV